MAQTEANQNQAADLGAIPDINDSYEETNYEYDEYVPNEAPFVDEELRPCNNGPSVITMNNVTKVYPAQPNKPALKDVSVKIAAGEFVFLVGHSGSGKSTFIRMLTNEIKPSAGQIMVAGQDLVGMKAWKVPYLRS